ncbi:MAG: peptidylprolyl isomerase [Oligoflexia bacterium]|nr:peptidylprolyl isomerase [Oligoflexia bacterium]
MAARSAGIDVNSALSLASRQVGDLATYLSVEGRAPPLPVDVRQASDPLAAYRDSLGITGEKLEAVMHTSMGDLRCELFWRQAPVTVGNFIGLATGRSRWVDATGQTHDEALYPGTIFHRVIPEFMVQGGDPVGDGSGGPGYAFLDETVPDLRFDRPGRLAMANSGPGTNGSQWFVTELSVANLDGKHTIFGQCDDASVAVVRAIARVPRDEQDKPLSPVILESIEFESSDG